MITLILGGNRSGKSDFAERLAARHFAELERGVVHYVATAEIDPADDDHVARVTAHRASRPSTWETHEPAPELLPALVRSLDGLVLLDALGSWIAAHHDFAADWTSLASAIATRAGDTIVVGDEVGLAVHPATEIGRRFADAVGHANQAVADIADRVVLVVAGRGVHLHSFESMWDTWRS
jgi:adenosyl cobinamide kinase/adenosyl cobinamide phosphate guanylyltransferase